MNIVNCIKTILIGITVILPATGIAQSDKQAKELDSLVVIMDTMAHDSIKAKFLLTHVQRWRRNKPHLALNLLQLLETNAGLRSHTDEFVIYYHSGVIYKNLSEFDASEEYLLNCLELEGLSDKRIANVHMVLSNLYKRLGHWEDGMKHSSEALSHYEAIKDTAYMINSLSSIGYFLMYMDQVDQGIEYHLKSLNLAKIFDSDLSKSIAYSNIGLCQERKNLLDSAMHYHHKSLSLNEKNEDKVGMLYDYLNIGRLSLAQKKPDYALDMARLALDFSNEISDPTLILNSQKIIGSALVDLGQYEEGVLLLEELVSRNKIGGTKFDSMSLFRRLHEAYRSTSDFQKSLAYMEKYHEIEKEMNGLEANEKVNELEIKYQTEKKASTIQVLQLEKEIDQQKIAQTNRRFWLALIGGLVLGVLLIGLYRLYRKSKVQEKALGKALTEKEILLREVHHRVKNNLQLISSILNLQYVDSNDDGVKFALQEGQNRVMSMSYIHQQLYQNDDLAEVDVKLYFRKLIQNLFESYHMSQQEVKLELDIDELILDLDTLIPLGLILNELISNSLKHAFVDENKGLIQVRLKQLKSQKFMLSVADDGEVGDVDLDNIKQGSFGLRMVQAFSSQLGGQLEVDNSHGTCFTLLFNDLRAA